MERKYGRSEVKSVLLHVSVCGKKIIEHEIEACWVAVVVAVAKVYLEQKPPCGNVYIKTRPFN